MSQFILVITSILVFPVTLVIFRWLPGDLHPISLFISGMAVYWTFLILSLVFIVKGRFRQVLLPLYDDQKKTGWFFTVLPFLPVPGVLFISLIPNIAKIAFMDLIVVAVIALISGFIEEVYWRGFYIRLFGKRKLMTLVLSPVLFGVWHISLWTLRGVIYHGGFPALVGGAFLMGLIWSLSANRLKHVRTCVIAHVLVNFCAFTGLFADNII